MKRETETAPLTVEVAEAVDRISGLLKMARTISYLNGLYYIMGHIPINHKNIQLGGHMYTHPEYNL